MPLKERLQSSSFFASRIRPIGEISHELRSYLTVERHNLPTFDRGKSSAYGFSVQFNLRTPGWVAPTLGICLKAFVHETEAFLIYKVIANGRTQKPALLRHQVFARFISRIRKVKG